MASNISEKIHSIRKRKSLDDSRFALEMLAWLMSCNALRWLSDAIICRLIELKQPIIGLQQQVARACCISVGLESELKVTRLIATRGPTQGACVG